MIRWTRCRIASMSGVVVVGGGESVRSLASRSAVVAADSPLLFCGVRKMPLVRRRRTREMPSALAAVAALAPTVRAAPYEESERATCAPPPPLQVSYATCSDGRGFGSLRETLRATPSTAVRGANERIRPHDSCCVVGLFAICNCLPCSCNSRSVADPLVSSSPQNQSTTATAAEMKANHYV